MTYLYLIVGVLLFGGGWYFGSQHGQAQLAQLQAAQSAATTKALQAQAASTAVQVAQLQGAVARYEALLQTPDPITLNLGQRLFKYAAASCPAVSQTPVPAGGTVNSAALPDSLTELVRLSQVAIDACSADAKQLAAIQQAWPK